MKTYKCDGQMSIFDFLSKEPEKEAKIGAFVKTHGKRVMFDDIQEGKCYVVDYSSYYARSFKKVYVKKIDGDKVMFVDSPRGVDAEWSWGNSFSAMTRAHYIDAEENEDKGCAGRLGWWFKEGDETDDAPSGSRTGNDIIDHLVEDLESYFDQKASKVTYGAWEHVQSYGKRLWITFDEIDDYDLTSIIEKYAALDLGIFVTPTPTFKEKGQCNLYISTEWKTKGHKEKTVNRKEREK